MDAGSRYEVSYTSGVSHFLHKLAFQVRGRDVEGEIEVRNSLVKQSRKPVDSALLECLRTL